MGALDEIAKIKTARRAEITARAEELQRRREAEERAFAEHLDAEIVRVVSHLGYRFLLQFRVGVPNLWDSRCRAEVRFEVPGHKPILLRLRRYSEGAVDRWRTISPDYEGGSAWAVLGPSGAESSEDALSDALIAAEIEGWQPPAPAKRTPSAEAEQAARAAWAAIFRADDPMPPGVAIDYVQNEAGDRDDAVYAIHQAAADWLETRAVVGPSSDLGASLADAQACASNIRSEDFLHADNCRQAVENANRQVQAEYDAETYALDVNGEEFLAVTVADLNLASHWVEWAKDAKHAIELCRAVAAAAHPEPSAST